MARLLDQGLDAGAIGVSTSRTERHRTSDGREPGHAAGPGAGAAGPGLGAARPGQRRLPVPVGQLPDHGRRVRPIRVRADHRVRPDQPATGQLHRAAGHRGARAVARPHGAGRSRSRPRGSTSRPRWRPARSASCSGWRRRPTSSPRPGLREDRRTPAGRADRRPARPRAPAPADPRGPRPPDVRGRRLRRVRLLRPLRRHVRPRRPGRLRPRQQPVARCDGPPGRRRPAPVRLRRAAAARRPPAHLHARCSTSPTATSTPSAR